MKHVAVTGASGYLGRHVVQALVHKGYEVTAIDINTDSIDNNVRRISLDIFSESVRLFEKMGEPDILLHLAWLDGFVHNSKRHLDYLPKHCAFLHSLLDDGLKHLIVMGTMHEVGYWEGSIDEDTPTNPRSFYGISKNALRQFCEVLLERHDQVVFQWLRAFYIYGDDSKGQSIFSKIVQAASEGKETFPFTTGKNMYDFISINELAEQIAACATQTEISGIINCCTGKPISLAEKIEEFILEQDLKIRLEYGAYPDRSYDSPGVWGDNTKIQKILSGI